MNFGERLKFLRESKNLLQKDLAIELGLNQKTISNYEKGERQPDFETLEKIADYFGVMVDYLLGRTESKTFNDYVYANDVHHLGEVIEQASKEVGILAVNIIDSIFLTIYHEVKEDNVDLLRTLSELYGQLRKLNLELKKVPALEFVNDEAIPVSKIVQSFSSNKNEINVLLDNLLQYYLKKYQKTT